MSCLILVLCLLQSTSDLVCLQPLRDVEIFTAVNWKKKHKSPTDFGFALKVSVMNVVQDNMITFCNGNVNLLQY